MYDYITKKQNLSSLPVKKNDKNNTLSCKPVNNTLLLMKKAHHQNTNTSQNSIIQYKQYTIKRTFLSNLWSYKLIEFFNTHLPGVHVYLEQTDYVGGSWYAEFTYNTDYYRAPDIDRVINSVPQYRDESDNSSDDVTHNTNETDIS